MAGTSPWLWLMIRLFAALAIPPDIAGGLARRQHGLPDARWRPISAFHITLRFFGDISEQVAADLSSELAVIAAAPLSLNLRGVGAFGEGEDLHAVWAGVMPSPALSHLAKACEAAARRAGLPPERRAYHPHVTLAYLRRAQPDRVAAWIEANAMLQAPPFLATRFGLYSSWRTDAGSRYRLERDYGLV